jgi:alkylation response protein AidB-like acyl-CoA dehydrogenase
MDLRYSEADEAFRAEIRAWLAREVPNHGAPPPPGDWPARRAYDTAWQRKLYDGGYAGLAWPAEFGGRGLPVSQQLVYLEEYARADAPYISVNFVGLMHAGPTLIAEGTDEQRARHLRPILEGDHVWCQGFSEPEAGSDLASLRTRATRHGDEYLVSGQKIWSTRAHVADYCELLVRTDPDAPKHKGITWLILDMHQPGVEVRPMRTLDGESHFCEVFLDEARVPVENRVGDENDGWRVTNVTLRFERGTAFAQHIITMRTQVRKLAALARARRTADGTAWDDPGLRRKVGRMDAGVEALWRMTQMGIAEAEHTGAPAPSGSAIKLRYSELSQEIAETALQVAGRPLIGSDDDAAALAREYLWSLQYTIAAGTSQIQRNLIAERILGMPKTNAPASGKAQSR